MDKWVITDPGSNCTHHCTDLYSLDRYTMCWHMGVMAESKKDVDPVDLELHVQRLVVRNIRRLPVPSRARVLQALSDLFLVNQPAPKAKADDQPELFE